MARRKDPGMGLNRLLGKPLQESIRSFLEKKQIEAWVEFVRFGGDVVEEAGLDEADMKEVFASMVQSRRTRRLRVPPEITDKLVMSRRWKEAALKWVQADRTYMLALSAVASFYYLASQNDERNEVVRVARELIDRLKKGRSEAGEQTAPAGPAGQGEQGQTPPVGATKPEQAGQGQTTPAGPAQQGRPAEGQTAPVTGRPAQGQPAEQKGGEKT